MTFLHYEEPLKRAKQYAHQHGRTIKEQIGGGWDGVVLSTFSKTAIKALKHEKLYQNEKNAYRRLFELDVFKVCGFAVPKLIDFDDTLWIVEMEIVSPPFIVDFAGASLDKSHDFPRDVLDQWELEKREQFEDRWPTVELVMLEFRKFGIYLYDVNPGNIMFGDAG